MEYIDGQFIPKADLSSQAYFNQLGFWLYFEYQNAFEIRYNLTPFLFYTFFTMFVMC